MVVPHFDVVIIYIHNVFYKIQVFRVMMCDPESSTLIRCFILSCIVMQRGLMIIEGIVKETIWSMHAWESSICEIHMCPKFVISQILSFRDSLSCEKLIERDADQILNFMDTLTTSHEF